MKPHLVAVLSVLLAGILGLSLVTTAGASDAPKLTSDEVVRKHLESIGTAQGRSAVTSRLVVGTSKFSYRANGIGRTEGSAVLASEGVMSLIGMNFPQASYPHERLGYDGRKFTTGFVRPGIRSVLGDFLNAHDDVFKEGLIGGTLNQAWPLLDQAARNAKLEYKGLRKIEGKETYVLGYNPKKGSEFDVTMFFDAETFHHVRTEYTKVVSAQIGRVSTTQLGRPTETSSRQRSTRYRILEEFSDYKKEGDLTLPHTYKIRLEIENQGGNSQFDWELNLTQYTFNQRMPADSFNVETFKDQ